MKEKKKQQGHQVILFLNNSQTAMTAKSLRLLALLAGLAVILPAVENVAVKRQVVQPAAADHLIAPGKFDRGAVESPPQWITTTGPGFQRAAVEYRPSPDFGPPIPLKSFNQQVFFSQFVVPALHVDHFQKLYPQYAFAAAYQNTIIQKGTLPLNCTGFAFVI